MRSKNACKTCALGMGGQRGGMVNEAGHFPEVCKKSLQAQVADMAPPLPDSFFAEHSVEELRDWSPRQLEQAGRLRRPLVLDSGASHYRPIEWEEAFDYIATQLGVTDPQQSFWYFSGRSSNEAGFLTQLLARQYGTNNVNNCSYYCHQASGVGLQSVIGSGTATVQLEDLDQADLLFIWGANPSSNHPRFMRTVMELRRRGGQCIVVNPLRERGLEKFSVPSDPRSLLGGGTVMCDLYIQPHIGGDRALIAGILQALQEVPGAIDQQFLDEHTVGADDFLASCAEYSWHDIVQQSGVSREQIVRLAQCYAASKGTIFAWAMGITHHADGVENVQALAALACMRGMVGRAGAGLLPLRGHSNVQGMGSMGVTPQLKEAFFDALQQQFELRLPTEPGLDTMACMERAAAGNLQFAWCLGGNLFGSNPDATFAAQALAAIEQIVYVNTTLNTGHAHGLGKQTLILPVLARDEEAEATTQESMFSLVRVSDGGQRRFVGPLSELTVVRTLAEQYFGVDSPVPWSRFADAAAIRAVIAEVVPGYGKAKDVDAGPARADQTTGRVGVDREFFVEGRHPRAGIFATATGRAQLHPLRLADQARVPTAHGSDTIRLMTIRSEGQFNTVVYEEEDRYRGQERRDVILLAAADRERLGFVVDQRVTVRSAAGSMEVLVREGRLPAGNAAMYYPEANVLVPRTVDAQSRTPAFKNVAVDITSC
jgi:molybdopterin-dependent oxidoreductase alpha subunit